MDLPCGQSNFRQIVVAQITRVFYLPEPLYQKADQQPNILPGLLLTRPSSEEDTINYYLFPPEQTPTERNIFRNITCRALQLANNQTYYIIGDFQMTDRILNSHFDPNPLDAMLVAFRNPFLQYIKHTPLLQSTQEDNPKPEIQFIVNIILPERHDPFMQQK
jgi:hypothetical protein